jgi:hypothetical protein
MRDNHGDEFGGRRGGPGGRRARRGGWQQADLPSADDAEAWLGGRLPDDWFASSPEVIIDREEITVIGELSSPEAVDEEGREAAVAGRISRFREDTRDERMAIARELEGRYGRNVAWGVRIGDTEQLFTHIAAPAMTRLRQPERRVLDTLVDAGIARSRSEALAWCVKLVGAHSDEWLGQLREAMSEVDKLRAEGPAV